MNTTRTFTILAFLLTASNLWPRTIKASLGTWDIIYDTKTCAFTYRHMGRTILAGSQPEASFRMTGREALLRTTDYNKVNLVKSQGGDSICFLLSTNRNGHSIGMEVTFSQQKGALLTRLSLTADGELSSNYLAPLNIPSAQHMEGSECRMLKVPFDNDDFARYHFFRLDTTMLSYEVTTIFDGLSRHGIVVGSVDHDHWKSGIEVKGKGGNTVARLKAYSGVSTKETRDILPHGSLVGKRVSSATFMIAEKGDWRDGMELFATICNERQPGRRTWQGGTPFGWQSWGVMATKNNIQVDMAVADFFAETLRKGGFAGEDGLQIMSIDAWDNLNDANRRLLTGHCASQGQITGIYRSPFSLWWGSEDDLERKLFEGCEFTANQCVLKANGKPIKYDGAFCLDPTHPAVKERINREMAEARRQGFRYVKVDFICDGIIQADRYFNPEVRTAVEAYNEGMQHFASQCYCADGSPMFIALSIAPIFPYQYGNSRRIACDTWGKISQSEYAMNAICGGWWTNGLYQRNDPDHIVLVGNDKEKETEGENRARLTTGIASGMLLLADNYDLADSLTGCGNPQLSVERAARLLANRDINELSRKVVRSFRPVFGYRTFDGKAQSAENFAIYKDGRETYVAVINYADQTLDGTISFDSIDISGTCSVRELWTGKVEQQDSSLSYSVPAKDARIYRLLPAKDAAD